MQRYFVDISQMNLDEVTLTDGDAHHLVNVMRQQLGDVVLLCTSDKKTYFAEITQLSKGSVLLKVVGPKEENPELPVFVTLAQGLPKGDKLETIVQKATECGAVAYVPVGMKRSIVKLDPKKVGAKLVRWQKIALEAARQSHRQVVPQVMAPTDLTGLINMASDFDVCLFAYEAHTEDVAHGLADVIAQLTPEMKVLVLVGPEGGVDETEVIELIAAGFKVVGLGPRIMRTETAPIYIMSALSYGLEIERRI